MHSSRLPKCFWMDAAKMLQGVFAVNKPMGMSSAQAIRDFQNVFNESELFKPNLEAEELARAREAASSSRRRGPEKQALKVKMGHGGTLDPLATGVLIVGVGQGTKSLQDFLGCTKEYEAVVLFGASSDTYDRVGKLIKKGPYEGVRRVDVEKALEAYRGKYKQMPPLYSALKMDGKPLYEYAREGLPLPRVIETREVEVTNMELVDWYEPGTHPHRWPPQEADESEKRVAESLWALARRQAKGTTNIEEEQGGSGIKRPGGALEERPSKKKNKSRKGRVTGSGGKGSDLIPPPPDPGLPPPWTDAGPPAARIKMTVTSGFYVRSFCHDLGEKLGSGAVMAELSRSRQGEFALRANCLEYDDIKMGEEVWGPKVQKMLQAWMAKRMGTVFSEKASDAPGQPQIKDDAALVEAEHAEGVGEPAEA